MKPKTGRLRKRRRRRWRLCLTPKGKGLIISILIGCLLGGLAGLGHIRSVENWKTVREAWAREQIARDREIEAAKIAECEADKVIITEPEPQLFKPSVDKPGWLCDPDTPEDVQAAAHLYGELYGIAPEFLEAVAFYESSYTPTAVNSGCVGLMQVAPKWHWDRMERLSVTEEQLLETYPNMLVAADYLRELFEKYEDPVTVLALYHGESDALSENYIQSKYVSGILDMAVELTEKHEGGGAPCNE